MTRLVLAFVLAVPAVAAAQAPVATTDGTHLVRAAGMPLADGALAPGTLTVRLVRGAFTDNLAGQIVEVEVAGGKVDTATTGADGRAQFGHLPMGVQIRARAVVAGERLESEFFEMPASSGVRLLLVADDGGAAESTAWSSATPSMTAAPPSAILSATSPAQPDAGAVAVRAVLATTTVLAFGAVLVLRRRPFRS